MERDIPNGWMVESPPPGKKTTMSENTIFRESYRAYSATARLLSSKNRFPVKLKGV